MKISEIRIDGRVMTKTGRIGRVTGALDTGRIYVLFGSDEYPSRMFAGELEPVSDSCHFAKGDKVRATGKSIYGANIEGKTFEVVDPDYHSAEHGDVVRLDGGYLVKSENLEKCDPRAGCQKLDQTRLKAFREGRAAEKEATGNAIDVLRKDRDNWKATAQQHCRNATYWREELTKLQREAMAESDNFDFLVASGIPGRKIMEERMPEKLLMSDDARIICELLDGSGPMTSREIAVRLMIREICVLESITEARDAGRLALVDGKYEIVRD